MPGVLDRQIDSLDLSATETAGVRLRHTLLGAASGEVEDLLAVAVGVYERLQAAVRRWQESVTEWESDSWIEQARRHEARYRRLRETYDRIAQLLADWEAGGGRAEGAAAFRAAKLDLDLLCQLSVERMMKADESLGQGRGRSMAEVRDELRRRLGA